MILTTLFLILLVRAIPADGKSFTTANEFTGYCFGTIPGPDEIQVTYLHDGTETAALGIAAAIHKLTRVVEDSSSEGE